MSRPKLWPVYQSIPYRMLQQMIIEGWALYPPLTNTPEQIRDFDASILQLRLLGWPVLSRPCPDSAIGLNFELHDEVRFAAVDEIKRLAALNQE